MRKKLKSMNILKGIGIIMIIIVHNRHFIMKDLSGYRQLMNYGQMGCQLFFLVSGMTLCYSWFHLLENNQGQSALICCLKFTLRRYLRLAPGFFLVMAANFLLNVLLMDVLGYSPGFIMNRDPKAVLANILFLHGLFPDYINSVFPGGWYIGTTFLLYLLFPILAALFQRLYTLNHYLVLPLPVIFLGLNIMLVRYLVIASGGNMYPYNNSFLYYLFTNQLPCFSLGILLYFQEADLKKYFMKKCFMEKCPLIVSTGLFLAFSLVTMRLYLMPASGSNYGANDCRAYLYAVMPSLAGLSFYWLAVSLIHAEHKRSALPSRKLRRDDKVLARFADFLAECGESSYGMYLIHGFVCWYGIKGITDALTHSGYEYNDLLLYMTLLLPSVFVVYVAGLYMEKLLSWMDARLQRLVRH